MNKRYVKSPWLATYHSINLRRTNPINKSYKYYGGKGIKLLITKEELKSLWFRDKAFLLKRPSIDRINSDGHYELKNCRYIELIENISRRIYTCKYHTDAERAEAKKVWCRRYYIKNRKKILASLERRGLTPGGRKKKE